MDEKICPFCATKLVFSHLEQGPSHKVINIKQGMPKVEQALGRLERELQQARLEGCRVLTLIHGYGSTGQGGVIREEVRSRLQYLKYKGNVSEVLSGEEFSTHLGAGRNLVRRFSFLHGHADLNRGNRGVTLVVL